MTCLMTCMLLFSTLTFGQSPDGPQTINRGTPVGSSGVITTFDNSAIVEGLLLSYGLLVSDGFCWATARGR